MDYFTEIEAHFAARRGTPFILSAKDWALMKEWHDAGVPLPVVIEAIDSVFENNETSGRKKVISSLRYCRHAVKEIWNERRELAVGDGAETPEEEPAAALERIGVELMASSAPIAAEFVERLRGLAALRSVPRIEEALIELEREMIDAIVEAMPASDRDNLRAEIARSLGDTSRLDEATRRRTEEANLRRLVRQQFALPRLSLFR